MPYSQSFALRIIPLHLLSLILFIIFVPYVDAGFTGPVVSVLDGDTIEVLHDRHPERIRLSGIDCSEKGQAYGKRAKQAASSLVFGKVVSLQTHGQDKYRRTLGDVFLLDRTPALCVSDIQPGTTTGGRSRFWARFESTMSC